MRPAWASREFDALRPGLRIAELEQLGLVARTHLVARISWADVWGRVGVEDYPSFRERDFAVAGQDYRRPVNLGERQIRLSGPRWEDATPSIVLLGYPPVPFKVNADRRH